MDDVYKKIKDQQMVTDIIYGVEKTTPLSPLDFSDNEPDEIPEDKSNAIRWVCVLVLLSLGIALYLIA